LQIRAQIPELPRPQSFPASSQQSLPWN
jgi:hypothetical protein